MTGGGEGGAHVLVAPDATVNQGARFVTPIIHWTLVHWTVVQSESSMSPPVSPAKHIMSHERIAVCLLRNI